MSESNDSRIEARECLREANRGDDSQNRWAWLVLVKSWLLLANSQEIAENAIEKPVGRALKREIAKLSPWQD
jgi:hypothetical protein